MIVQQILSMKPQTGTITIAPSATLNEAVEILSAHRIGAVVVSVDGKTVAGILSERDVVRELGKYGTSCLTKKVDQVMTSKIVSCGRSETALEVLQTMTDGRFRHMPVIEGGQMIGLISIGDVVKARLAELAAEKDALEGMIKGY